VTLTEREGYALWRAQFPWSDQEFAQAMQEVIKDCERNGNFFYAQVCQKRSEAILRGHLSGKDMRLLLPRMVKHCELCGKTALYRMGALGRCREHRMVPTKGFLYRKAIMEAKDERLGPLRKDPVRSSLLMVNPSKPLK